jgi:hypothetical protein
MAEQAKISYRAYDGESDDLNEIINLMESELSEPYIIVEPTPPFFFLVIGPFFD